MSSSRLTRGRPSAGWKVRSGPRFMLYSHDGAALGHRQRNLKIAGRLMREFADATALLVTGAASGLGRTPPPGVDYLKLPTVAHAGHGTFEPLGLDLDLPDLYELRASVIEAAAAAYRPDIVLVDFVANGIWGELLPTLEVCAAMTPRPRIVLGLRDILDDAAVTLRQWHEEERFDVIARYYDQVLVYGSKELFDTAARYDFPPAISKKVAYCGHIAPDAPLPDRRASRDELCLGSEKLVVVTGGGGYDALAMMSRCAAALQCVQSEPIRVIFLCGPLMSRTDYAALRGIADPYAAEVWRQAEDPLALFAAADLVLSMGGYNTLTELIALGLPTLVMPRRAPSGIEAVRMSATDTAAVRNEQALRADTFAALGAVEVIAHEASATAIAARIDATLAAPPPRPRAAPVLRLDGLDNAAAALGRLLRADSSSPAPDLAL